MMIILFKVNFRYILNFINCVMTSLNIITIGWILCWKNILEIFYLIFIAIIVKVSYVYYFALFASLFTCMVGAAIMGFVFIMKVYSMKNSQAKFTYSKFLMFYLKMIG